MHHTEKNHIQKYYGNYIYLIFILISSVLAVIYKKENIYVYYLIAIVIFALLFDSPLTRELGFSIKVFKDKKLILFLIPSIILSNFLLVIIQNNYIESGTPANNNHLILGFIFFNSVRILGEEFIFRGFLLLKSFKANNQVFWILNITQAFIFSLIHASIPNVWAGKIALGSYTFILSIYFGWLNRKFNSILPSWIIHWMNGLQTLVFAYF